MDVCESLRHLETILNAAVEKIEEQLKILTEGQAAVAQALQQAGCENDGTGGP